MLIKHGQIEIKRQKRRRRERAWQVPKTECMCVRGARAQARYPERRSLLGLFLADQVALDQATLRGNIITLFCFFEFGPELYMTSDLVTVPQLLTDLYTFHWIDGAPYKISILMLFALWTTPFFLILCTSWQLNMYLRISHLEHCESLLVPATKECVHQVYQ